MYKQNLIQPLPHAVFEDSGIDRILIEDKYFVLNAARFIKRALNY